MESRKINTFRTFLTSKSVGLDSMMFLYHFADDPTYAPLTEVAFSLMEQGKLKAVTTSVSVAEVFVRAEEKKDQITIAGYERFFHTLPNLDILSIDWNIARLAAKIRGDYRSIRLPDALQLAGPIVKQYPIFLTNDEKLKKVKEITVVVLDDYL